MHAKGGAHELQNMRVECSCLQRTKSTSSLQTSCPTACTACRPASSCCTHAHTALAGVLIVFQRRRGLWLPQSESKQGCNGTEKA